MKVTIDHLLYLIKEQGTEKALECINIESIEDDVVKIISRTIKYSCEELQKVLIDRIAERDLKKGASQSSGPIHVTGYGIIDSIEKEPA